MGARLVYPDFSKKIVAVCGDGGFMMNSQELETCVREKLDLVVVSQPSLPVDRNLIDLGGF